jgi:hypothetical protein
MDPKLFSGLVPSSKASASASASGVVAGSCSKRSSRRQTADGRQETRGKQPAAGGSSRENLIVDWILDITPLPKKARKKPVHIFLLLLS